MQVQSICFKLRLFFPNHIQNIPTSNFGPNLLHNFHNLSSAIASNLPHLSIDQIHTLCKKQQKNVMDKIIEIKTIDLYQEIADACPSQKNLKSMTHEQVITKINQQTPKFVMQQVSQTETQDQEIDYSQQQMVSISNESPQNVGPMEINDIQCYPMSEVEGLCNIFEEQYNTHLAWNQMCIYD